MLSMCIMNEQLEHVVLSLSLSLSLSPITIDSAVLIILWISQHITRWLFKFIGHDMNTLNCLCSGWLIECVVAVSDALACCSSSLGARTLSAVPLNCERYLTPSGRLLLDAVVPLRAIVQLTINFIAVAEAKNIRDTGKILVCSLLRV